MAEVQNIWSKIWANKLAKEFILTIVSAIAIQLGIGLSTLIGALDTVKTWGDLTTTITGWAPPVLLAITVTTVKQAVAWGIAHLGGNTL